MNVIEPCPQLMRLPRDASVMLEHANSCAECQAQVRQLKPACNDPALGLLASLMLGEPESVPELGLHLDSCLACRLERLGFESLEEQTVVPRSEWMSRLRLAAQSR